MSRKKDTGTTSLFGSTTKKEERTDRMETARTCGEIAGVSSSLAMATEALRDGRLRLNKARATTGILTPAQTARVIDIGEELGKLIPTIEDCRRTIDVMVAAGIAIPTKKADEESELV